MSYCSLFLFIFIFNLLILMGVYKKDYVIMSIMIETFGCIFKYLVNVPHVKKIPQKLHIKS